MKVKIINKNQFFTGDFKSHASRLSNKEYSKILDNIVFVCTDCVILNKKGEVLLGKRSREPYPFWWIIGGRMLPGESFEQAMKRALKRELNITINPKQLFYLNTYSHASALRAQKPKKNGTHCISITMVLFINDKKIKKIKPNDEYEELKWFKPREILKSNSHPAIKKCVKDLIEFL